jgi:hypothetical protein
VFVKRDRVCGFISTSLDAQHVSIVTTTKLLIVCMLSARGTVPRYDGPEALSVPPWIKVQGDVSVTTTKKRLIIRLCM